MWSFVEWVPSSTLESGAVTISLSLLTAIASGCVIQYANSRPEDYDVVDAIEDAQDNRAIFADSD